MVPAAGFEPTTSWFEARRSIQLSYAGGWYNSTIDRMIALNYFLRLSQGFGGPAERGGGIHLLYRDFALNAPTF